MTTDDKPADVFVLKREATSDPFVFEYEGERYEIPHIQDVDFFDLREQIAKGMTAFELFLWVIETGLGDRFATLRGQGMNRDTWDRLSEAYQEHCGISTGESLASSK